MQKSPIVFIEVDLHILNKAGWLSSNNISVSNGIEYHDQGIDISFSLNTEYPYPFVRFSETEIYFGYSEDIHGYTHVRNRDLILDKSRALLHDIRNYYLGITIDLKSHSLIVDRDYYATLPLYILVSGSRVVLSSDYAKIVERSIELSDSVKVHMSSIAEYLLCTNKYDVDTINGISAIKSTESITVSLNSTGSIKVTKDQRDIKVDEELYDILNAKTFDTILESVFNYYNTLSLTKFTKPIWDFSGGLDSTILVGSRAHFSPNIFAAYSADIDPYVDEFLKSMSIAMHGKYNFEQYIDKIPTNIKSSFYGSPLEKTAHKVMSLIEDPGRLIYERGPFILNTLHGTASIQGHGADELFTIGWPDRDKSEKDKYHENVIAMPSYYAKHFLSVIASVYESAEPNMGQEYSLSKVNRYSSSRYLERGIWPILPFYDPYLYMVTKKIAPWRKKDKQILRNYMKSKGYPSELYAYKKYSESASKQYNPMLKNELMPLFFEMLESSVLVREGFILKDELLESYNSLSNNDYRASKLQRWLDVEVMLHTLMRRSNRLVFTL